MIAAAHSCAGRQHNAVFPDQFYFTTMHCPYPHARPLEALPRGHLSAEAVRLFPGQSSGTPVVIAAAVVEVQPRRVRACLQQGPYVFAVAARRPDSRK